MAAQSGTAVGTGDDQYPVRDRIEELGIVGAGGGGFPASVKFKAKVSTAIVNAAECEPLLHKDKELLLHYPEAFFQGLSAAMQRVGAQEGIVGIKKKYGDIIEAVSSKAPGGVRVVPLPDVYPAGDEFVLVHEVTGRVIPPGGLPKDVNAVVSNVETLVNIGLDQPVTHKFLTVAGAVDNPVTLRVPIGISLGDVLAAAGGANISDFSVLVGGVMMAKPGSLGVPVTKTTGGIVVLPTTHKLIQRHTAQWRHIQRIGRSACDQCRFCTEFCPRYLLGHPIQPHRAMQSLGFSEGADAMIADTLYCCECNLCTLYACPEELDPKSVCAHAKPDAREKGLLFKGDPSRIEPHPLNEFRRVPMHRLMAKLGLTGFKNVGPLVEKALSPRKVVIPLKQHAGAPSTPVVRTGDRVRVGDLLAVPPEGQLGARVHASIDGATNVSKDAVTIEA
jgi:Na+-translocating ferredoxin:NAD+ oxidoreductase RnfC subunit